VQTIPFTNCIDAALKEGSTGVVSDGQTDIAIEEIAPDLVGYQEIPSKHLTLDVKLGAVRVPLSFICYLSLSRVGLVLSIKEHLSQEIPLKRLLQKSY
jgi:hypothetical protein